MAKKFSELCPGDDIHIIFINWEETGKHGKLIYNTDKHMVYQLSEWKCNNQLKHFYITCDSADPYDIKIPIESRNSTISYKMDLVTTDPFMVKELLLCYLSNKIAMDSEMVAKYGPQAAAYSESIKLLNSYIQTLK